MTPREPELVETGARPDGAERARVRFEPDGAVVRVPSGTPVFDAASWNGIAIDSTCGGHGTCKKCKVRVVEGELPVSTVDPRAFSPDELSDGSSSTRWRFCTAGRRITWRPTPTSAALGRVWSGGTSITRSSRAAARQASRQPSRSSSALKARGSTSPTGTSPSTTRTLHFLQVP